MVKVIITPPPPSSQQTCKILSNVRCLSEGVDVPALDAVLFLSPRNSQVEVVQAVGRVMRKPKDANKKLGYVILPVVIPADISPEEALNDNKTYKAVWQVLQALRSHDDQLGGDINRLSFDGENCDKIEIVPCVNYLSLKSQSTQSQTHKAQISQTIGTALPSLSIPSSKQLSLGFEIERGIRSKIVERCGNRIYWQEWAEDIGRIAQIHIQRISAIINNPNNTQEKEAFEAFLTELRDDLNDSITEEDAVEMLAQHLITQPVFNALFEGYQFAQHNPVSKAIQSILDVLAKHHLEKETSHLSGLYESIQHRATGTQTIKSKQALMVELYDKFFRKAFPRVTERLGIAYTPIEVVDFIIHSVNKVLKKEFNESFASKGVHIIEPFTGTGTFITRLLQSGLIPKENLDFKYQQEIHANEILLLAYYLAAVNIEQVYHDIMGGNYTPFEGICLTDTFALHEKDDLVSRLLEDNSDRRKKQKNLDIRVIMSNPPYSIGQKNENDNNANVEYPTLDKQIQDKYVSHSSKKGGKRSLYDSYIRAIRWASNRVGTRGVIGFVTNAGFIDSNSADGLRKCLINEFSSLYIFHLRGNARTSGERAKQEGGLIFDTASRLPIAISIFVKNPNKKTPGQLFFHDIGDYLNRKEKFKKITEYQHIFGINWAIIVPNKDGDWINQGKQNFNQWMILGNKQDKNSPSIFRKYSYGAVTSRDAWCYNFGQQTLAKNIQRTIDFYNTEIERFQKKYPNLKTADQEINRFVNSDPTQISWGVNLKNGLKDGILRKFQQQCIVCSLYRPFTKLWFYSDKYFNHSLYSMPQIFPNSTLNNRLITVTGLGAQKEFCAVMVDKTLDFNFQTAGAQCFPLYLYEKNNGERSDGDQFKTPHLSHLFGKESQPTENIYSKKDGISDAGLAHFQQAYPTETIVKEDVFYYVYGLLHSTDYKTRYANNLTKTLPHIPRVKSAKDFWAFSKAGRELGDLHVDYESVEPYQKVVVKHTDQDKRTAEEHYRVVKMKFANKKDKSCVIYNPFITISDIPLEAYDYVVNGKSALEWVMERQAITQHKESGIQNNANQWAIETMHDPAYPLNLFLCIITVSLKTMAIVKNLPALEEPLT